MSRKVVSDEQPKCGGGIVRVEEDDRGRLFVHCTGHDFDNQVETGTIPGALGALAAHLVRNK